MFWIKVIPFKDRLENHTRNLKHETYYKSTELFKYIWALKETGINPTVKWSIVEKIYNNTRINYCKLGPLEILLILLMTIAY